MIHNSQLKEGKSILSICLLALGVAYGCGGTEGENTTSSSEEDVEQLVFRDTLILDYELANEVSIRLCKVSELEEGHSFTFLDPYQGKLMSFDLGNPEDSGQILADLKPLWPAYTGMKDYYYTGRDSVILVPDNGNRTNTFLLVNRQGEIIEEWKVKEAFQSPDYYSLSGSGGNQIYFEDNSVHSNRFTQEAGIAQYQKFNRVGYQDPSEVIINLKPEGDFEIQNEYGKYPDPKSGPNTNLNLPVKAIKGDTVLFAYTYFPYIYGYSKEGEFLFKRKIPVKFDFQYFEDNQIPTRKDLNINSVESDQIYHLVYDRFRQKYYITLIKGVPYHKKNGRVRSWQEKKLQIVILNMNFEHENKFEVGRTGKIYSSIFPLKKGVYFLKKGDNANVVLYGFEPDGNSLRE